MIGARICMVNSHVPGTNDAAVFGKIQQGAGDFWLVEREDCPGWMRVDKNGLIRAWGGGAYWEFVEARGDEGW